MKNKILYIFLIIVFLKGLAWMFSIPIYQSPDEIGHFAYTQRIAEKGYFDPRRTNITSKELNLTAEIFGFNWAKKHPYWNNYQKDWQEKALNLPYKARNDFDLQHIRGLAQRTQKNSPLFYFSGAGFYKAFYGQPFLVRFYAVRFFCLLLSIITVFFSYKIGRLLFKRKTSALVLACLVAFQPMFSFISVSINNDNLLILLITLFIYFSLNYLKTKNSADLLKAFFVVCLGIAVKPQALIVLPAMLLLGSKKNYKYLFLLIGLLFFSFFVINFFSDAIFERLRYVLPIKDYFEFFTFSKSSFPDIINSSSQYLAKTKEVYFNELFPWYWGVFGWLEAVMPMWVYKILKIVSLFSIVGLAFWFFNNKNNKKEKTKYRQVIFIFFTAVLYYLGLFIFDLKVFIASGDVFGIQGRYFLPVISAQMCLLFLGLKTLIPKNKELYLLCFLVLGSVALNIIGFWSMYAYFYG